MLVCQLVLTCLRQSVFDTACSSKAASVAKAVNKDGAASNLKCNTHLSKVCTRTRRRSIDSFSPRTA